MPFGPDPVSFLSFLFFPNLILDPAAGSLTIDAPDLLMNGYVIESAAGLFTGEPADNLGWFTEDNDLRIRGNMGFELGGIYPLGKVIGPAGDLVDYHEDLTFTYTIQGTPGTFAGTLVVVPEPGTLAMLVGAIFGLSLLLIRRRRAGTR